MNEFKKSEVQSMVQAGSSLDLILIFVEKVNEKNARKFNSLEHSRLILSKVDITAISPSFTLSFQKKKRVSYPPKWQIF